MEYPAVAPIVTTAVLEVTVFVEFVLELVVLVEVFVCCATAVMFTWPLFVEGTTPGAV
jgi:hypothetical protein